MRPVLSQGEAAGSSRAIVPFPGPSMHPRTVYYWSVLAAHDLTGLRASRQTLDCGPWPNEWPTGE